MPFIHKHSKNYISRSKRLEISTYRQGLRHGIVNSAGDLYKGQWKNDNICGKGNMWTIKGQLYEGDFERNYRHGYGTLAVKLPDCNVYQLEYRGEWRNGHMHGEGVRIYPDGSFYFGRFVKGKRNGFGQMWYADNGFYSGQWSQDKRHGPGLYVDNIGNRYEGTWHFDIKHGEGIYYHLDSGQIQEGLWKDDICIISAIYDIPFRQTSKSPSPIGIPQSKLTSRDQYLEELISFGKTEDPMDLCLVTNDYEYYSFLDIDSENDFDDF